MDERSSDMSKPRGDKALVHESKKNAVVLVVDRLGTGMLGPYGSTWFETPNLNRLASCGLLFDFAVSDSTLLEKAYRSYWTGLHALQPADLLSSATLPKRLLDHGIESTLVTDERQLEPIPSSQDFSQFLLLPLEKHGQPASDIEQTSFATITAAAISLLEERHEGHLLWIHAAGLSSAWDAPLEFRNALADEEDPTPPTFVEPPSKLLDSNDDPDEVLGVIQAYGGQVSLLDVCLGALIDAIDAQSGGETLFILTSPRGFPLGEHRRIGAWDSSLYNESLAVPLVLRVPGSRLECQRSQILVQPPDLFRTLLGWFEIAPVKGDKFGVDLISLAEGRSAGGRDRACSIGESERALRTPAWFLRQAEEAGEVELYVKPDDRWEMNNVVQRCPAVAEEMQEVLDNFQKCAETGFAEQPGTLSDVISHGLD